MTRFDEYGAYGENNPPLGQGETRGVQSFSPQQIQQIEGATKRAHEMREMGHNDGSIEFALNQEGYAAAAIKQALGVEKP